MAEVTRWSDLRVGLIVLGSLVAIALAVLMFADIGGVRGKKVTLFVTADATGGLMKGGDVYIAGKQVGKIKKIDFQPPATDTTERLVIETVILESTLSLLRQDSYAQIAPAGTFLGTPVLGLSAGSSTSPPVRPGDTLRARPFRVAEGVMARLASVGREFGALKEEFTAVTEDMRSARGTFGALNVQGPRDMGRIGGDLARFQARITGGGGTVAAIMNDPAFGSRFATVRADVDSIRLLLNSQRGTVGRFRRDTTLAAAIASVRDELALVQQALDESRGTAGRAQNDRAIQNELAAMRKEMDELMADFKKNPFRYISL